MKFLDQDTFITLLILVGLMIPGAAIALLAWPSLADIQRKLPRAFLRSFFIALALAPAARSLHGILISGFAAICMGLVDLLRQETGAGLKLASSGVWPICILALVACPVALFFDSGADQHE